MSFLGFSGISLFSDLLRIYWNLNMICLILRILYESYIYVLYNFDTVLYQFLETGTSERTLICLNPILNPESLRFQPIPPFIPFKVFKEDHFKVAFRTRMRFRKQIWCISPSLPRFVATHYFLLIFRNNSSVNKKKSKKGFVKDFTNNNLAGTPPTPPPGFQDSTILARYTEEIII